MTHLPAAADIDHLKKQAKDLIRQYRAGDPVAIARFAATLPAAAGRPPEAIVALTLRLHDAQSCIAREYGFASWPDLAGFVAVQAQARLDPAAAARRWLEYVYDGDVTGIMTRARPALAARMLGELPAMARNDPYLACAAGDHAAVARAIGSDPGWVDRPGGPLHLPPLLAVTHSSLVRHPATRDGLHACARLLIAAGADANQRIGNRWPPASLRQPDDAQPLSALYGAAGRNHDAELTRMLLAAGADPNDGESLYHSLENPACTRLLLEYGARIGGNNIVYRALDLPDAAALDMVLAFGADANEPARCAPLTDWGSPLLWAIRRRRSVRHIAALLQAGADTAAVTPAGVGAWKLALQFGLTEVAALLQAGGEPPLLSAAERFVAACARADAAEARRLRAQHPDLPGALPDAMLRLLPDLAGEGARDAVTLMVSLGWPVAVRGGDWDASALNHAVFRGDAALTQFLLAHGASWTERQGFGDDVCGTLSWASCNAPVEGGDWVGCARALLAHGMPAAPARRFSDDVATVMQKEESASF